MASGDDPIGPDRIRADAAHAMSSTTPHQHPEGRFGRELRGGEPPTPGRPAGMPPGGDEEHPGALRYEVDVDAVAAALVERLLAGRTIRVRR